ncbi:MAG: serine/threonine protein kinase [Planctomycetota bacterium]|nr:MAG: serine/threonine protein kinase [Planctomycetota bacterium]
MSSRPPPSSGSRWCSEEDYYLARLATHLGLLEPAAIEAGLTAQAESFRSGRPIGLGDALVQAGLLDPAVHLNLIHELMRSRHVCPGCGSAVYAAPGPTAREHPCPRCGAAVPVPPAASVTASGFAQREEAIQLSGTFRLGKDVLAQRGAGPTLFGAYVLERELARGGMGAVYRVRHAESGQAMALKVMLAGSRATEKQLHRFRREARAQFELDHPNIVKIHDVGEHQGVLYYAMELVEGKSLDDFRSFELPERLKILAKVCRAIHHAHTHGYIHRDLKPANILIDSAGRPRVTDFGLAKNIDGTTQLTQEGAVMGTPFYMAPEQATGNVEAMGPHTDVFALGVLLYQLVTGELPFEANTAIELYRRILEEHPRPFVAHGVLEPQLERVAFKALEKAPELRYASALELAEDIERCLRGEDPQASAVSTVRRVAIAAEKHRRSLGFVLGTIVLGLAVLVGAALVFRTVRRHFREAKQAAALRAKAAEVAARLERAVTDSHTLSLPEAARGLDEAIAAARGLLAGPAGASEDAARLHALRRGALVRRAELALSEGSGRAAREAMRLVGEARDGATPSEQPRLLALQVRACWRLGRSEEAERYLAALREAPGDGEALALLEARDALRRGDYADARRRLGELRAGEAELLRARALWAEGERVAAQRVIERALPTARKPGRLLLRWGEALLAAQEVDAAAEACRQALLRDPSDEEIARRLASLRFLQGRPLAAAAELAWARERCPDSHVLRALLARARWLAGESVRGEAEALRGLPEADVLLADLADAAGEEEPYAALDGAGPELAVLHARWRADRGAEPPPDPDRFAALFEDVPRDRPPSPRLARALRAFGWVLRARGDASAARRAAAEALRGLPGDLDAHYLLARLDPQRSGALEAAFVAEADQLEGALGRGLFLARSARLLGRKDLALRAQALLRARLAGQPSLVPVRAGLVRLAGLTGASPPDPGEPPLLDWARLLPPQKPRKPFTPELRRAIAAVRRKHPGGSDAVRLERARAVLKVYPWDVTARDQFAAAVNRSQGRTPQNRLLYLRAFELTPGAAYSFVFDFMTDWVQDTRFGAVKYPRDETKILLAEDAEAPLHQVPWILDHYLGLTFGEFKGVEYSQDASPREVVRRIDRLLRLAPGLSGFLYPRAHLVALAGGPREQVERDLSLVDDLARSVPDPAFAPRPYEDWLYRLWIYAPDRLEESFAQLEKLRTWRDARGRTFVDLWGKKQFQRWQEWVRGALHLAEFRSDPRWEGFLAAFR